MPCSLSAHTCRSASLPYAATTFLISPPFLLFCFLLCGWTCSHFTCVHTLRCSRHTIAFTVRCTTVSYHHLCVGTYTWDRVHTFPDFTCPTHTTLFSVFHTACPHITLPYFTYTHTPPHFTPTTLLLISLPAYLYDYYYLLVLHGFCYLPLLVYLYVFCILACLSYPTGSLHTTTTPAFYNSHMHHTMRSSCCAWSPAVLGPATYLRTPLPVCACLPFPYCRSVSRAPLYRHTPVLPRGFLSTCRFCTHARTWCSQYIHCTPFSAHHLPSTRSVSTCMPTAPLFYLPLFVLERFVVHFTCVSYPTTNFYSQRFGWVWTSPLHAFPALRMPVHAYVHTATCTHLPAPFTA